MIRRPSDLARLEAGLEILSREARYHELVRDSAYQEALTLITDEADKFPEHVQHVVYCWRFRMAALLNKKDLTLQLLHEAVQAGHWYHGLAADSDFGLLQGHPEFERLVQICQERRTSAMNAAVPVWWRRF